MKEFEEVEKLLEEKNENLRKMGIHTYLSPIIKPQEIDKGGLLFLDMTEDALILFDRENFFDLFLKNLSKKLNKLGARRIKRGNRVSRPPA